MQRSFLYIFGRLKEMESTAESTRRELDQDKLRLAPKRYKEAFLSFRCEQHVIDDLEKCYKALSYSITQFHKVGKFFFFWSEGKN